MAEVWVVNASPLIVLDRLGQLDLLARLGHALVVPGGVLVEISRGPRPIAPSRLGAFRTATVEVIDPVVAGWDLGRGESEVLTCAASEHADVVVLGAGLAGLRGRALMDTGVDVVGLEAGVAPSA